MAIDKSGKWWVGKTPEDLKEYLDAFSEDSYPIHEFRLARCDCGSLEFQIEASDEDGVARRTCAACRQNHFLCDSEENWSDAETKRWRCTACKSRVANVAAGFSLTEDRQAIHWLYVGERCVGCGVLGCLTSWKIGYSPSLQLMDLV